MSAARDLGNLANTTALKVTATDVGIQTATPSADLDIGGNILMDSVAGVVTATKFQGDGSELTSLPATLPSSSGANLTNLNGTAIASGTVAAARVATLNQNTTGTSAGLTGTPSIVIQDLVGVGATFTGVVTYEDVTNIDAIGVVTARAGVDITGGTLGLSLGTGATAFSPASNTLTLGTNNAERIRILSTGSIGINTTTGSNTVNIAGAAGVGVKFHNTTSGYLSYITVESGDVLSSNVGGTGAYKWITGGSEKVRITNAGNLGIGTDLPVRKVTLAGDSATSIIELKRTNTNTTGAVGALSWTAMDGHCVSTIQTLGDGDNEGGNIVFKTTTAAADNSPYDASLLERVKITSIGDVEISGSAAGVSSCTWDASQNYLNLKDSSMIVWGDSQDLKIYHDGSHAYIANTTGNLILQGKYGESSIKCEPDNKVTLWYDNALRLSTTTTGVSIANTCSDAIGDLRSVPLQDESGGAYILAVSDKGQCVHAHGSTTAVTVNINTFAAGDVVSIVNGSSGNIAITQGTSFTLRNTSDSSTGSLTLASFGMATIWFSGHNVGYISGSGLS
tara:strand:- start:3406 stop:5100 length:1695 start_codon:yes stop_codon:yes gene_type:complete